MFTWSMGSDAVEGLLVSFGAFCLIVFPIAFLYHGCYAEPETEQAAMAAGSPPAVVRLCPDCAHRLTCQECGRPLPSHTKDQQK